MKFLTLAALILLAAPAAAQFDAYPWSLHGCASVGGDHMDIDVCGPTCAADYSWAWLTWSETGTLTMRVDWFANHAGQVTFRISRKRPSGEWLHVYALGEPYGPTWCDPAPIPCAGGEAIAFHIEAADELHIQLDGQEHGCGGPLFDSHTEVDLSNLLFIADPLIHQVSGTWSFEHNPCVISGEHFDATSTALVDGQPVSVLAQTATQLVIGLDPGTPGFHDLTVTAGSGLASTTVAGGLERWPSVAAADTGVGGQLDVSIGHGAPGLYFLFAGLQILPTPLPLGPPIEHGLEIDPAGFLQVIGQGTHAGTLPALESFALPGNPALGGTELYFQALTQRGFSPPELAYSFSNLALTIPTLGGSAKTLLSWSGSAPYDLLGGALDALGDIDLDGLPEVLAGAPGAGSAGQVYVFPGAGGPALYTVDGTTPGTNFGGAVAAVGELSGDGREDFAIGAPLAHTKAGEVTVHSGRGGGVLHVNAGLNPFDGFGGAIAGLGDLNSDGSFDYAVGAPHEELTPGGVEGSVSVLSGADGGLLHKVFGDPGIEQLGAALSAAGDADGDGVPDYLSGAPWAAPAGIAVGVVRLHSGVDGSVLAVYAGSVADAFFGSAVATLGDVDLDGFPDLAVGAPHEQLGAIEPGALRVFSGASGSELYTLHGAAHRQLWGHALDGPGDVNLDGVPDLLVGAPGLGSVTGRVELLSGQNGALLLGASGTLPEDTFGTEVAGIGSLNGDSYLDLLIGVPNKAAPLTWAGQVLVLSGVPLP